MNPSRHLASAAGNPALHLRLDAPAQARLERLAVRRAYPRGAIIFPAGSVAQGVFLVVRGVVTLLACRPGGALVLRHVGPGEAFGMGSVLTGERCTEAAVALYECEVAFVPAGDFRQFLHRHPAAAYEVLKSLSEEVADAYRRLACLAARNGRKPAAAEEAPCSAPDTSHFSCSPSPWAQPPE